MKVQLISFSGCPNVENARRALRQALASLALEETFEEVDSAAHDTPDELKSWGSPTILVDGVDVAGGSPSGRSCRTYPPSEFPGAPPMVMIVARLRGT